VLVLNDPPACSEMKAAECGNPGGCSVKFLMAARAWWNSECVTGVYPAVSRDQLHAAGHVM